METNNLGIGSRVEHPHFGRGVIVEASSETYTIWFKSQSAAKSIGKDFELKVINATEAEANTGGNISLADIEEALDNILERRLHEMQIVPMGNKWNNGVLIMKPGDDSLQQKEMPIETFFHKIVMVRDRLRLIEQKVNSSKALTDEEKVDIQQYITAVYGSLTTFNVLFKETHHQFKGMGGKD
ncbi:MAG: hypothetical protein EOP51_09360 [Sphingobacteriales bacterium]|nr:MAG: hypothetical protein EOP51_09360 [Sphingobacteriales bacterium]